MAKINQLSRFGRIINRLSGLQEYVPTEELLSAMQGLMSEDQPYTIRTLQRDILTIAEVFGVEIENRRGFGYHIVGRVQDSCRFHELLNDYEIVSTMKNVPGLHEYIIPEHRSQVFSVDIKKVLQSIAERRIVKFGYHSAKHDGESRQYSIEPYYLKQSQGKWYLFGLENGQMRSFELGRFESYHPTAGTFVRDLSISLDSAFKDTFGIWNDPDKEAEDILLKVSSQEWSYIKTYPIHSSQKIVSESDSGVIISLRLKISYDFIMDLMGRCPEIEVLEPKSLRKELHSRLTRGANKND